MSYQIGKQAIGKYQIGKQAKSDIKPDKELFELNEQAK